MRICARTCVQSFTAALVAFPVLPLIQANCTLGSLHASARTKKSWCRTQAHEDVEKHVHRRYRREVRQYVRRVDYASPEQGCAATGPPEWNLRRPSRRHRSGASKSQMHIARKAQHSIEHTSGTHEKQTQQRTRISNSSARRPENPAAAPGCMSGSAMKEALSELLAEADGAPTSGPMSSKEETLWKRFRKKPSEFWDNRGKKQAMGVQEDARRIPDFVCKKHPLSGKLWLSRKPHWLRIDAVSPQSGGSSENGASPTAEDSTGGLKESYVCECLARFDVKSRAGTAQGKLRKIPFSLSKQFTALSVEDLRIILGEDTDSDSIVGSSHTDEHHLGGDDYENPEAQFVATGVPLHHRNKSRNNRKFKHKKFSEKKMKGEQKRKHRKRGVGCTEFWDGKFGGRGHRRPSRGDSLRRSVDDDGYSSDDEFSSEGSSDDDEGDAYSHWRQSSAFGNKGHGPAASAFHADFRSKFWRNDGRPHSKASHNTKHDHDPFVEYIEFTYGQHMSWDYFEAFDQCFSGNFGGRAVGGFKYTGDVGGGDYYGSFYTGDHTSGASDHSTNHAGERLYCPETQRHLNILELTAMPSCKAELKTAYLKQAKKHHPDSATSAGDRASGGCTNKFLQAKTAYEYLQQHCDA